jgi:hypothetical protein
VHPSHSQVRQHHHHGVLDAACHPPIHRVGRISVRRHRKQAHCKSSGLVRRPCHRALPPQQHRKRRRCLRDSQPRRRSPVLRAGATSSRQTPCRVARRKRATVVTTLRFGLRDQKYGDDIAHLIHCPPTPTPWCLKHANLLALVCSSRPYRPARRTRNIHHPAHHRFRWHRQSQGSIRAKLAAQVPAGSPRIQLGRGVSYLHEDDRVAHIDDAPKPIHMSLSYMYQSTHLHCQDSTYQPCASARHAGLRAGFRVPPYATTSVEFEPRR